MGENLSFPEMSDGQPRIRDASTPTEGVLLSKLIQLLSQRPRQSIPLSDLDVHVPVTLRQQVREEGGIRSWLQRFPSICVVFGEPGEESVTLVLGTSESQEPAAVAAAAAAQLKAEQAALSPEKPPSQDPVDEESALQLRGLPYRATDEDIRDFLGDFASHLSNESSIRLVTNRDGRPSGFATVQLTSPEAAQQCRDQLHLRSMEDRYVEVFVYSERPLRGRQRRGAPPEETSAPAARDAGSPGLADAVGISREQVVRECRAMMAETPRILLSMLGVALSPGARKYLKQTDQGLKHFLAQFPQEFSIDGAKGCEYVAYTPTVQLKEAIDGFGLGSAPQRKAGLGAEDLLASPSPATKTPLDPTPSAVRGLATPSDWGTPSAMTMPWGGASLPTPWLPPWPADTASGGVDATNGCASWPAPPAWPLAGMTEQQAWPGWPPAQSPAWGAFANPAATPSPVSVNYSQPLPPPVPFADSNAPDSGSVGGGKVATAVAETSADDGTVKGDAAFAASVRLRGLPFSASEQDVLAFFAQHDIVDRISNSPKAVNLLLRSNGRPSGQAVVQMCDRADAELAQQVLSGQWMGSRYIEVFLYGEEGGDGSKATAGTAPSAGLHGTSPSAQPQALSAPQHQADTSTSGPASGPEQTSFAVMPPSWLSAAAWGPLSMGLAPAGGSNAPDPSYQALFEMLSSPPGMAAMAGLASIDSPVSGGMFASNSMPTAAAI
mmetsp:Transcript_19777/g.44553  ORF Transcript_19777/g.44553 Transcript_19777/m.44553 type:complete len:722 (+) Transcript_19777:46-2211(+)